MKKLFILISLFAVIYTESFAQMIAIPLPIGQAPPSISTIPVDSGKFFTLQLTSVNTYNSEGAHMGKTYVDIELYSPELKSIGKVGQWVSYLADFRKCVFNKSGYAFIFHAVREDDVNLLTIDFSGKLVKSTKFDVANGITSNQVDLFTDETSSNFYLVTPIKKTLNVLTKLDLTHNTIWKKDFAGDKHSGLVGSTFHFSDQKMVFDYSYEKSMSHFTVDTANGNTIASVSLPAEIKVTKGDKVKHFTHRFYGDSLLVEFGYYFHDKERVHEHQGFYFSTLNLKREVLFEQFYPIASLEKFINKTELKGKLEKLVPNFFIPTPEGYLLVAETVDKVPSGAFAAGVASGVALRMIGVPAFVSPQISSFQFQDFIVARFDKKGTLISVQSIPKYTSYKTIPFTGLTELNPGLFRSYSTFDVTSYVSDGEKKNFLFLLKENSQRSEEDPRIAYLKLNNGTSSTKQFLLTDVIKEEKKVKEIDWFLLSTGDVVLKYRTKTDLNFTKVAQNEFK